MSKFEAIGFRVHVKPDVNETEVAAKRAGLVLAPTQDRRQEQLAVDSGVVVAVGPTAWADYGGTPWVKVGDKIVYARHAGYRVGEDEDAILVINDGDVVTKILEDASV